MSQLASILTALQTRLTYHTTAGQSPARILEGLNWEVTPVVSLTGVSDLPALRQRPSSLIEEVRPGGRLPTVAGTISKQLLLQTAKSAGEPAMWTWVEKVLDALQTAHDATGALDVSLTGKLREPMGVTVEVTDVLDISYQVTINLELQARPARAGGRQT